jgi:ABC-2 type transport system permease protein
VGLLAVVTVVFLVIGIVGFRRRDIGSAIALPGIGIGLPAGTGGPFRRRLADSAGISVAAGLGIGSYGALIAGSAEQFAEGIGQMAGLDEMIGSVFPGVDISQPTGLLQLAFFGFGALLISMAAAGFVGGLTSDETNNRLDQILASPIGRGPWFVRSGLGALASVVVTAVVIVLLVGGVVAATGGDVVGPIAAGVVIALYGASFVGIGLAIAGVWRPGIAAVATAAVAFSVYLLGTLGSALQLPDWLVDLSLIRHVGQPLVGDYDAVGMAVMAALAVGGLAIGAWGFRRRDVNR